MFNEVFEQAHTGHAPAAMQIPRKAVNRFQPIPKPELGLEKLTAREWEVLALLAQGYLYKEIACSLCISINTVRNHQRAIYGKLNVHSRTVATLKYLGRGVSFKGLSSQAD